MSCPSGSNEAKVICVSGEKYAESADVVGVLGGSDESDEASLASCTSKLKTRLRLGRGRTRLMRAGRTVSAQPSLLRQAISALETARAPVLLAERDILNNNVLRKNGDSNAMMIKTAP